MTVKIRNIANRMVALHCNSGQTIYFAVGIQHDLPDVEVADNPMFEKLVNNKLLQLISEKPPKHHSEFAVRGKALVAGKAAGKEEIASDEAQPAVQGKAGKTR